MEEKKYNIRLSKVFSEIVLISFDEVSLKKDVILKKDVVIGSLIEEKTIITEVEITIKNQKIGKINLSTEKLEESDLIKEELIKVYKEVINLVKKDEEKILSVADCFKVEQLYNLDDLVFILEDEIGVFFVNNKDPNIILGYNIEKKTNNLYFHYLEDIRNKKKDLLKPQVLISNEIIKKNHKFRLKHLLRNYTKDEKKG